MLVLQGLVLFVIVDSKIPRIFQGFVYFRLCF